jgi:hypothetical protein
MLMVRWLSQRALLGIYSGHHEPERLSLVYLHHGLKFDGSPSEDLI